MNCFDLFNLFLNGFFSIRGFLHGRIAKLDELAGALAGKLLSTKFPDVLFTPHGMAFMLIPVSIIPFVPLKGKLADRFAFFRLSDNPINMILSFSGIVAAVALITQSVDNLRERNSRRDGILPLTACGKPTPVSGSIHNFLRHQPEIFSERPIYLKVDSAFNNTIHCN